VKFVFPISDLLRASLVDFRSFQNSESCSGGFLRLQWVLLRIKYIIGKFGLCAKNNIRNKMGCSPLCFVGSAKTATGNNRTFDQQLILNWREILLCAF
jgi:hypothetical protein